MKYFTTTALTLLLMVFAFAAFANNTAKTYEGSVTLENGETLSGKIEMLSPILNEIKVKFIDNQGIVTIYKAKEVVTYRFAFSKYNAQTKLYDEEIVEYVKKEMTVAPIPFGPKEVLVERQVNGSISLYNFYIETLAAAEAFVHHYLVEKDGKMIELNTDNYKGILQNMVANYPELQAKVGQKGYTYKYISNIIEEYNQYLAPKGAAYSVR